MKKLVVLVLVVAMMMATLIGCASAPAETENTGSPATENTGEASQPADPSESTTTGGSNEDLVGEGLGRDYGLGACGFDLDALVERMGADNVKQLRIGVTVAQQTNNWQIEWADELKKLADEYGFEIQVLSADSDAAKEVDNVKSFVAQDMDAIISYASNPVSLAATLTETNQTIPIINAVGDATVEVDAAVEEFTPQELMGQTIADQMAADANGEERNVLLLDSSKDLLYLRQRLDGFEQRIAEKYPNIHVIDTRLDQTEDGWLNQSKESLLANPEINAIFATYTAPMMGGYNAAKQLNIEEMHIYGIDADEATLGLVEQGEIDALYIQFPRVHAYWSIFNTLRVLSGEQIDPVQQYFPDWSPYGVYTVTPANVEEARGILYPEG